MCRLCERMSAAAEAHAAEWSGAGDQILSQNLRARAERADSAPDRPEGRCFIGWFPLYFPSFEILLSLEFIEKGTNRR